MTYLRLAGPAGEAVTLAEAKAHARIDGNDEDALIASLIAAAREYLEAVTGLCLMTQRFRLYLDQWPADGVVQIDRGPVQAIETVTVYGADGTPSEAALAGHVLDGAARPARLMLADPPQPGRMANGIEIDFSAGFGDTATDVPDGLKRAMLLHVSEMFSYRGAIAVADQPASVPAGYEALIAPYRMRRL
jgi:uncharacterized phiE125 gp8 family phage protein